MHHNVKIYFLLIILVAATSCATTQKIETARSTSIYGPGVIQKPVLVDLEVSGTKVSGRANGFRSALASVKNAALSDALKNSNADVLVEPVYDSEVTGSRVIVTVSGYPATYKNFRAVSEADIPLLETGVLQRAAVSEVIIEPEKRREWQSQSLQFWL